MVVAEMIVRGAAPAELFDRYYEHHGSGRHGSVLKPPVIKSRRNAEA
jgi:hypothetical protein